MAKASMKSAPTSPTSTTVPSPPPPPLPPSTPAQPIPPLAANESNPVHTIRYGAVRGSIWRTESPQGVSFTVTIDRFWVEKKQEQTSQRFLAADLQQLAKAAAESRSWIEWQERRITES